MCNHTWARLKFSPRVYCYDKSRTISVVLRKKVKNTKKFLIGGSDMVKSVRKSTKLPPTPPNYLSDLGSEMWKEIVPFLNKNREIKKADEYLVARYCVAYDTFRTAYELVKKDGQQKEKYKTTLSPVDGSIVARDFTGYAKNPAVQNMKDAINQLNTMGKELGLSPKSRNDLINLKKPEKKENKKDVSSEIQKFFGERK